MFTNKQKTITVMALTGLLLLSTFTVASAKGKENLTQKIMTWVGYSATVPDAPEPYSVYYDTQAGSTQIYDNGSWLTLAKDGEQGPAGPAGPIGPQGEPGPSGDATISSYFCGYWNVTNESSRFYPDSFAVGTPITFMSDATVNKGITLSNNTTFQVTNAGKYLVSFNLTVNGKKRNVDYTYSPASVALKSDGSKISNSIWIYYDGLMSGSAIVDLSAGQSFSLVNVGNQYYAQELDLQAANITIIQIDS